MTAHITPLKEKHERSRIGLNSGLWRNKKTGVLYRVFFELVDCTNAVAADERVVVAYGPDGDDRPSYVREKYEFMIKFEKVEQ